MATTREDLKLMFEEGQRVGATHMLVATDWFDHSDYPIYVMSGENPREAARKSSDRIMECYKIALGWETQGAEYRANHWD